VGKAKQTNAVAAHKQSVMLTSKKEE